jgi:hypothetical protein
MMVVSVDYGVYNPAIYRCLVIPEGLLRRVQCGPILVGKHPLQHAGKFEGYQGLIENETKYNSVKFLSLAKLTDLDRKNSLRNTVS